MFFILPLFCFSSLVIFDVVCRYLSLFVYFLYINIEIEKQNLSQGQDSSPYSALPIT